MLFEPLALKRMTAEARRNIPDRAYYLRQTIESFIIRPLLERWMSGLSHTPGKRA